MNTIEKEEADKTGLRCDVITLFNGGQYHLYRYKRYTDVRLVFAPEDAAGNFGGDPDNFEYPRFDLDICLFRVYENGRPAKIEHFLQWAPRGAADGELIFVSGNPAKTDRLDTVANLNYIRDISLPLSLDWLMRSEVLLTTYGQRSEENERRCREELLNIQNSRKANLGRLAGLQDPALMAAKQRAETALREAVAADPRLRSTTASAWDDVAAAMKVLRGIQKDLFLLEEGRMAEGRAFRCRQFRIARTLVRMAEEDAQPNAERLREYRSSNRQSLEQELYSEAPIYNDLETVKLADSLSLFVTLAGADSELVRKVLDGKSPPERAAELIQGTRLNDVEVRRELAAGGVAAVRESDDPMIKLALLVDGPARKVRRIKEQQVDEPLRQAYAKIAQARFRRFRQRSLSRRHLHAPPLLRRGEGLQLDGPPHAALDDAGRRVRARRRAPQRRALQSAAELAGAQRPSWTSPPRLISYRPPDIIGGNSGSPVVNRQGQFVGIIFDGNLESLLWDFVFSEKTGRAISVHAAAIDHTLRKVYGAARLADELGK